MTKTRTRALCPTVKEEDYDDKSSLKRLLHKTDNVKKNKNKVTKSKTTKVLSIQPQNAPVNSENVDDISSPPPLPSPSQSQSQLQVQLQSPTSRRSAISSEQIAKLISYIIHDKLTLKAAAKKATISENMARVYYKEYQSDPEHKIPLPKTSPQREREKLTQNQLKEMFNYILHDNMSLSQAASKVKIEKRTATRYYEKYLEDPDHKVPALYVSYGRESKKYTREQVRDLISYLVVDKMSLVSASKKVGMPSSTARSYYTKYKNNPAREVPSPSRNKIPMPEIISAHRPSKSVTRDQVKSFFRCVIVDNLNITQASQKANISKAIGRIYFKKYLKKSTKDGETLNNWYTVEKMKEMVEYIERDNLDVKMAANLANLNYSTARKYYRQYLNDPLHEIPLPQRKQYKREDVKKLIHCIENDKMSLNSAAKKLDMCRSTANTYFKTYRNNLNQEIPVPLSRAREVENRVVDDYSQMIADIYQENALIKPLEEEDDDDDSITESLDMEIKLEAIK